MSSPRSTKPPLESRESEDFTRWLRRRRLLFCHVPNEGRRSQRRGAALKRQGLSAGVPDFLIFTPPPRDVPAFMGDPQSGRIVRAVGVAVEMKRRSGGRLSDAQRVWLAGLSDCGWLTYVTRGADAAIEQLTRLGYS